MTEPLIPLLAGDTAAVPDYLEQQAGLLRAAYRAADPVAATLLLATGLGAEPLAPDLPLETARRAVARDHGYADWAAAASHTGPPVDGRFEAAAGAIQWGDVAGLRALLDAHPALTLMRSPFPHHATLLHHVSANGIEVERQLQSPPEAPQIARLLLDRGAEPDAGCDTYGGRPAQTPLYLLVSSAVPAAAGVQAALVGELCRGGARPDGPDGDGLPLWTAITFGYGGAAAALARCGARVDNIVFAAALGDLETVRSYLGPGPRRDPARSAERVGRTGPRLLAAHLPEYALIWAARHGRRDVVEYLLGQDPDLSVTEPCFGSTALGAAVYGRHEPVAEIIRAHVSSCGGQSE